MYRYTIYCTEVQTKKALELGAPLEVCNYNEVNTDRGFFNKDTVSCYRKPTAEQMIGWLTATMDITTWHINYFPTVNMYGYTIIGKDVVLECDRGEMSKYLYKSSKEATLAAIDAALEYLVENNLIK